MYLMIVQICKNIDKYRHHICVGHSVALNMGYLNRKGYVYPFLQAILLIFDGLAPYTYKTCSFVQS